ncbi:MAG: MFS transporter [Parvibaculum sp.]|uniref:MFS transporter n=1 Tax=Parvibaculum sp. TaxID=2024848 RepID=UPI0025D4AFDC|nr:MFS transporter [Parvibaculum sp.]MCE9649604.1 MFS transporter [Parvibaculum sp.]
MAVQGELADRPSVAEARTQRLRLYFGGQASWFISLGIQFVLFPYLATELLHETPARVGIAQMSLMAPALLFILLGGTIADHSDVRRILVRLHVLSALPPLILFAVILSGHLSYGVLIAYALAMGTLSAFAMPARDSALNRIAETNIQQAVTLAMGTQMGSQLLGMLVVSMAFIVGVPALLLFQMTMLLGGAVATGKLDPLPPEHAPSGEGRLAQIVDGIAEAWEQPITFMVIVLNFAVGLFYVGSFMVVLPLMMRDVYNFNGTEFTSHFAMINIAFWGGTITATIALLKVGHIERRGRVMIGAVTAGFIILGLMTFTVPFPVLSFLCFCWGVGAGTTMTMGRTIVQIAAKPSHRARVLAFYQLGFSGGAPIGSLIMGFLVGGLGVHQAVLVPAGIMVGIVALLFLSPIWHYHAEEG